MNINEYKIQNTHEIQNDSDKKKIISKKDMQVELKSLITSSLLVEDYDCRMETQREKLF